MTKLKASPSHVSGGRVWTMYDARANFEQPVLKVIGAVLLVLSSGWILYNAFIYGPVMFAESVASSVLDTEPVSKAYTNWGIGSIGLLVSSMLFALCHRKLYTRFIIWGLAATVSLVGLLCIPNFLDINTSWLKHNYDLTLTSASPSMTNPFENYLLATDSEGVESKYILVSVGETEEGFSQGKLAYLENGDFVKPTVEEKK